MELIETLASHMLILGGAVKDFDEGLMRVRESIQSGKALDKFKQFVAAQGGDTKYIDHPELFEQADIIEEIRSEQDGFVGSIDAQEMGICSFDPWWRKRNEGKCDRSNGWTCFLKEGCGSCEERRCACNDLWK